MYPTQHPSANGRVQSSRPPDATNRTQLWRHSCRGDAGFRYQWRNEEVTAWEAIALRRSGSGGTKKPHQEYFITDKQISEYDKFY